MQKCALEVSTHSLQLLKFMTSNGISLIDHNTSNQIKINK